MTRANKGRALTNIKAINDPFITPDYFKYMFKYDTVRTLIQLKPAFLHHTARFCIMQLFDICACADRPEYRQPLHDSTYATASYRLVPIHNQNKPNQVHGEYKGTVEFDDKHLIIDGHKIRLFHEMDPANIKWCVFCYAWGPPCVCGPCGSSRRTDGTARHTRTYHHHPTPPSP